MPTTPVEEIKIGMLPEEVITQLGDPIQKIEKDNNVSIFVYSALPSSSADYIYFLNQKVILIAKSMIDFDLRLEDVLLSDKSPQLSYLLSSDQGATESLHSKEYFFGWNDDGFGYLVSDATTNASVLRYYLMPKELSESDFLSIWGSSKDIKQTQVSLLYVGEKVVTESLEVTTVNNQTFFKYENNVLFIALILLSVVVILVFSVVMYIRRNKKLGSELV